MSKELIKECPCCKKSLLPVTISLDNIINFIESPGGHASDCKLRTITDYREIWVSKDGKFYLISEMGTSHIKNCINLINKYKNWRKEYLVICEKELARRNREVKIDKIKRTSDLFLEREI